MRTASSPGPFTRCGVLTQEGKSIRITYENEGITHTVYLNDFDQLQGDRFSPPVPLREWLDCGSRFVKVGYASRSPSGRALIITTTTSAGNLTVKWTDIQHIIHGRGKRVPVSRINAQATHYL